MSHFVKDLVLNEYLKRFSGVREFVVISTVGISGIDNNQMRGQLRQKGLRAMVVSNSLMRRAAQQMGLTGAEALFASGQCTVVYGGEGAVLAAKEVIALADKYKAIALKGAYLDGAVMLGNDGVKACSAMPTRTEMLGRLSQTALSPGGRLVGAILSGGGLVAGCVKALIEKREKEAA